MIRRIVATLTVGLLVLGISQAIHEDVYAASDQVSDSVISGTIVDWPEGGPNNLMTIGDGLNHVTIDWSVNRSSSRGWFYGRSFTQDSDVAFAAGIRSISELTNAESLAFNDHVVGPLCDASCASNGVGDFVVWRNNHTGYYGALRIEDIYPGPLPDPGGFPPPIDSLPRLQGTWWFQTNGSDNFSSVPEPSTLCVAGLGLLAFAGWRLYA